MSFVEKLGDAASSERAPRERQGVSSQHIQLEENIVHILNRNGQTLRVLSGLAWVTFRGDTKDYFVEQGEEIVIRRGRGKAQVSALYGPLVFEV